MQNEWFVPKAGVAIFSFYGSSAAGAAIGNNNGMRFERPVPESTRRRVGYNAK